MDIASKINFFKKISDKFTYRYRKVETVDQTEPQESSGPSGPQEPPEPPGPSEPPGPPGPSEPKTPIPKPNKPNKPNKSVDSNKLVIDTKLQKRIRPYTYRYCNDNIKDPTDNYVYHPIQYLPSNGWIQGCCSCREPTTRIERVVVNNAYICGKCTNLPVQYKLSVIRHYL